VKKRFFTSIIFEVKHLYELKQYIERTTSDYIIFVKNNELNADENERVTATRLQRQTGSGLGSRSRTLDRNESEQKCKINIYGYYNIRSIYLPVRWLYTRVIRINFPTQAPVYLMYLYRLASVIFFEGQYWDESKSTPSFFLSLSLTLSPSS